MEDVLYANELLPDFAGFILAPGFWRRPAPGCVGELTAHLDARIGRVGVFVNQPEKEVAEWFNKGIIDYVQLHGDEDNAYIRRLKGMAKGCPVIKAVRIKSSGDIKKAAGYECEFLLLDAYSPDSVGGSGETFDWTLIKDIDRPFFLAGGISPKNVAHAIKSVNPYAIDASSSLETDRCKDFEKMKALVEAVREI